MLRSRLFAAWASCCAALLLASCFIDIQPFPTPSPRAAPTPTPPLPGDPVAGQALYLQLCAVCHGDDGQGYVAPAANALSNQDFLVVASNAFLEAALIRGRPGTAMPVYDASQGGPIGPQEAQDIVAYLRTWQTEPTVALGEGPVQGDPSAGLVVYQNECVTCHGVAGQGGLFLTLSNPVFLETASDAFLRYSTAVGRRDTFMNNYSEMLPDSDIDNLVAYLRSLAP